MLINENKFDSTLVNTDADSIRNRGFAGFAGDRMGPDIDG